jgi:hypothetical protein
MAEIFDYNDQLCALMFIIIIIVIIIIIFKAYAHFYVNWYLHLFGGRPAAYSWLP